MSLCVESEVGRVGLPPEDAIRVDLDAGGLEDIGGPNREELRGEKHKGELLRRRINHFLRNTESALPVGFYAFYHVYGRVWLCRDGRGSSRGSKGGEELG